MDEDDIRQLLTLIRGIEHFLERQLKTLETRQQIEEQGIEITEDNEDVPEWNEWEI